MVIVIAFLTPAFYYLPSSTLASIIVVAVYGLLNFSDFPVLWKVKRADLLISVATSTAVLTLGMLCVYFSIVVDPVLCVTRLSIESKPP